LDGLIVPVDCKRRVDWCYLHCASGVWACAVLHALGAELLCTCCGCRAAKTEPCRMLIS